MNSSLTAFTEPGLWSSVWKLLRMRLVILFSSFRRAKPRAKFGMIVLVILILAFFGFVLFMSIILLRFMRSPELAAYVGDVSLFVESVPTLLVSISAAGILFTSFGVLLQVLYLSGDMDFLMSAPIPIRAVFIAKLVQAVLPNFLIMCAFTLPILFGLGVSAGYNFLYYPLVLIVLAALTLASAGLGSLLVLVAARYFPAKRLAEVLGFVVGTFFFIFSQTSRFMHFDVNNQQVSSLLNTASRFNRPWSPLAWAGQGLVALGKGNWLPAVAELVGALLISGGIFYLALYASERMYYTGWSSLQNNRRKQKAKPALAARSTTTAAAAKPAVNPLAALIPAPIRAILLKDLIVYRRDLRNASQLITPLIMGVVYAVSLLQTGGQIPAGQGNAPAWFMGTLQGVFLYADVALALFLGWMLVANLAGMGFSHEGKSYWMLKAAPLSARQLLSAKYLAAYLPTLVVCVLYVLILQVLKGGTIWSAAVSLVAVALSLAGVTGIYMGFGAAGAKFDWENPSQANRAVGCLGTMAGMAFLPVCFALFIGPALLAGLLGLPVLIGQLAGLLLGGAAGLAAAILPLLAVEKRVEMMNEA
jgi:ABC-2 type transport system permease protein